MKQNELEDLLILKGKRLAEANSTKMRLEKKPSIIEYCSCLKQMDALEKEQKFLQSLEVGEDGCVFAPYDSSKDKGLSRNHFGLSNTLQKAFFVKYKEREEYLDCNHIYDKDIRSRVSLVIYYDNFDQYLNHARKVLQTMKYMEGDRLVDNPYQLEIYENPKSFSVVNFSLLSSTLTQDILKSSYSLEHVRIHGNAFLYWSSKEEFLRSIDKTTMTKRENEAFYGEKAISILESKGKVYSKNARRG